MKSKIALLALVINAGLTSALHAQTTTLFFVGGNSTVKIIQDRWSTLFGGTLLKNSTNANIFRYSGATVPGVPGTVNADFNLTGGAGAVLDLKNQTQIVKYDNTTASPTAAITAVAPETIGIDSSIFNSIQTVVVPVVFVKNTNPKNDLGALTNLTQRTAAYLAGGGSGALPTAFFGGNPTNTVIPRDAVYFVGRNSLSAARQLIDANIYFSGSAGNYTTNSSNIPIAYLQNGQPWGAASGTEVVALVNAITNSIGYVSPQDIGSLTPLNYEGVPFTVTNVINGTYPIWGVEQYLSYPSGAFAPSANQQTVINELTAGILDTNFEHTNSVFVGKFVAISDLQVSRTGDGGPISSSIY